MSRPKTYLYAQGSKSFEHRWGKGPAEDFKKARQFPLNDWQVRPWLGGQGCAEITFSTTAHKHLQVAWPKICRVLGLNAAILPVYGRAFINSFAKPQECDGVAAFVFIGKDGSRWSPIYDVAAWSGGEVWFRAVMENRHIEPSVRLLGAQIQVRLRDRHSRGQLQWL